MGPRAHAKVLRRVCLESLKIQEQASAAEGMGTTRWSERRRARATPGPISQGGELRLSSKAVVPAGAILSPWDTWQYLGTFLAVTTWGQGELLTSSGWRP